MARFGDIARKSRVRSLVTLLDGREIVLSGTREVGHGNRGVYVDDRHYGRVLVSWDAFESIDFSPGGSGPAYDDFPPGRPMGNVTTRAGRLVYDLGEGNGGMLIFVDGGEPPVYVPWTDIEQVDFDRPAAMYPPLLSSARSHG